MKKVLKIVIFLILIALIAVGIGFFVKGRIEKKEKEYTIEEINDYSYFIYRQQDKFGVIDKDGNTVIEPTYDEVIIPNPSKDIFICYIENTSAVLNSEKKNIFDDYDQVEPIRLKNTVSNLMYEKSVLVASKDGKMGLINFKGEKITDLKYDSIEALPYQEGKLLVKQNGKVGIINMKGYELIKCDYNKIDVDGYYDEKEGYKYAGYIVSNTTNEGYRYGYANYNGEILIEPECNELSRIPDIKDKDNAYIILAKNGKFGIYRNGEQLLANDYQSIRYESGNEVFVIEKSKTYGVVNSKGNVILPIEYQQIDITGICIYATKDSETKIFDKTGKQLEMEENTSIINTSSDKYKVELSSEDSKVAYGVVNSSGNEIIPKKYSYIDYLSENYFSASDEDGKFGIINDKNEIVVDFKYDSLQKVEGTDVLEAVINKTKKTDLYSIKAEKICDTITNAILKMKDKYIYAYADEGTKYINTETLKEEKNTEVFRNNKLFAQKSGDLWGFIYKEGNVAVEYKYDKVTEFNKYGYAGIKKDGKWGVIKSNGEVLLEPTYEVQEVNESGLDFIGKYYGVEYGFGEIYYTDQSEVKTEGNVEETTKTKTTSDEDSDYETTYSYD